MYSGSSDNADVGDTDDDAFHNTNGTSHPHSAVHDVPLTANVVLEHGVDEPYPVMTAQ